MAIANNLPLRTLFGIVLLPSFSNQHHKKSYQSPSFLVHGKEPLPTLDASEVQVVKKELATIRDKVNALLDALTISPKDLRRIGNEGGRRGRTPTEGSHTETKPSGELFE